MVYFESLIMCPFLKMVKLRKWFLGGSLPLRLFSVLFLCILVAVGCSKEEEKISYDENPNVVIVDDETETEFKVGIFTIKISKNRLYIEGEMLKKEVGLPHNLVQIKSFHLSHDQYLLAFDAMTEDGMKVFMYNVNLGKRLINVTEKYNYDGYVQGHGLAWAPNDSILAIITGYEPNAATVRLYDAAVDTLSLGSPQFKNIHGVKWSDDGKRIYYVVDTVKNDEEYGQPPYMLYKSDVKDKTQAKNIEKIDGLSQNSFNRWFQQ
jgi:hypothetical protein